MLAGELNMHYFRCDSVRHAALTEVSMLYKSMSKNFARIASSIIIWGYLIH